MAPAKGFRRNRYLFPANLERNQAMKPLLLPATWAAAAIFGIAPASGQTIDTSTGTILDSSSSPSASVESTTPKSLAAVLGPAKDGSKVKGIVRFSMAGDAVNVSGRVDGLEPNKSYRLAIELPVAPPPPVAKDPSEAGPPDAGAPQAGQPTAPPPAAGKPDGTERPGAPGAGTEGSPDSGTNETSPGENAKPSPLPAGDLGVLTADSAGGANVNTLLRNVTLGSGATAILGQTVTVTPIPEAGDETKPGPVADGRIEATKPSADKPVR